MRSSFLFVFFMAGAALAQLAPPGPQAAYEGQNVSAVSLLANPHRDLAPLRSVITQKAGEPYSQQKVEESAAALQQKGGFEKVQVNLVPEIQGLRLNFVLEPAWYLGVVEFPGVEKRFSYTRLQQVVNLADEDPYDPARISVAESALREFLHKNGYFLSKVHAEPQIDDTHRLVNVNFVVEMGKQARIGSVKVEGPANPESTRLLRAVRSLRARLAGGLLKPGKAYTGERISAATNLMKKTLVRERRLASHIEENAPQYHPDGNRVDVSFQVEVGPVVTVRTTGARLTTVPFLAGRQMKKLIPIYSEGTIDRDLVDEGQRNLIDYFQKKGFYDVKVNTKFERQPDQILVVYEIDRGKKHKVDHILFGGIHELSEKELLAQVTVKKSHIWSRGSLSQKLLKQSADNIEALYRDRGYEDVKVTSRVIDREPKIDLAFDIEEGPQTLVADLQITGNQNIPYRQLAAPKGFQLLPGTPFSSRKLAEDRNGISATYLNRGYLNAEVKVSVDRSEADPHRVSVAYAITERQLVRISDVVYLGQKLTRLSLIRKTAQLPAETPMRRGEMLKAESRLYDLNVFDWSSVGPRKPITDQSEEDALVKVHEAKRNEITYGFGFEVSHRGGNVPGGTVALPGGGPPVGLGGNRIAPSQATFASPRGLVEFNRRNLRGLGETASASLLMSRLDQRVLLTYSQPFFAGSRWSSLSSFSVERTSENPLFTAGLGDLSFQVERQISQKKNTRLQLRYDFNRTTLSHLLVPDLVLDRDRHVRLSTLSGSLIRDTRDKPLDAHHGMYSTLNLSLTPAALGSSATFAKLFAQYAYYKPVHSIVFANSIRIGMAKSFAQSFVPTSQLFFSGGGTSLRSFPINEAGPQRVVPFCNVLKAQPACVNVTVPVGGRELFILNSEVRFPLRIMNNLGGVVFYDGGNVYSAVNFGNFLNNYTNTVGFGLRYSTPIGPIRFDIGHNLNPVRGINPTQYYITVGQAF
ncbi:MAG TPA: POTRA domain-containing protein [Terriglobales bacterium]|nr:POTRA domain-containing protein [Terriglobales bacterium]